MKFLLNLKPSVAHHVRVQIEEEGAMWANSWYKLMQPFIWFASYFAFYNYSEGSFNFRRLPISGQITFVGQKMFRDRKSDPVKRNWRWKYPSIGATFYGGSDGADRSLSLHFCFFLFGIYLTFEDVLPKRWQPQYLSNYDKVTMLPSSRQFRFYIMEGSVWLQLWENEDDHRAKETWLNKMHVFHFPWSWAWVRTSKLLANGEWFHETYKNRLPWKEKDALEKQQNFWTETHPYKYVLRSGEVQLVAATVTVSEQEWNWRWFKWLGFPRKVSKTIWVEFSDEVGEERGSWKGGTVGCGYALQKGESPLECLRRMEKERKFER
jgi:hypothetical protein